LWQPTEKQKNDANLTRYIKWLEAKKGLQFMDYNALWEWSVKETEAFWESLWEYFEIKSTLPYSAVLKKSRMPGAEWFPGARLNFAEHVFRNETTESPALIFRSETVSYQETSWEELRQQVSSLAHFFRKSGVEKGDRVAAYLPNTPHAFVGMLAASAVGAVWSSCSPDFGTDSVIERFSQIEPKVLITVNGYRYNGKAHDRRERATKIIKAMPGLKHVIHIPYLDDAPKVDTPDEAITLTSWENAAGIKDMPLQFEAVPFDHPLWVLYSSGTTGLPKPIVHGHGGMLLEHLKYMEFHADVRKGDRFFWFSTTGWMMWNVVMAALLRGATAVVYDGSPAYPDMNALWDFADASKMTTFGTSATYIVNCMKQGIEPANNNDLSSLRSVGSTGSPLPPEGFKWVYEHVGKHIQLNSTSGGTDICSSFVGGNPLLPVHAGEIQCRILGASVYAFNEQGEAVTGEVGEMVITKPMPCMPVYFWGDEQMKRYKESYFGMFPGVWRHGDWLKVTGRGSCVIYGRSDATLNKMGVRIGTSEIYRAVETNDRIKDSLVVSIERPDGSWFMPLFVVLGDDNPVDDQLRKQVAAEIRERIAPRFVPDEIISVKEIPYTLSGKKMEKPVKRILEGIAPEKAASRDSMKNSALLEYYGEIARTLKRKF
ncbi:MAG: acetoacetate--CoA ligase, partial [Balneolia bacterium]|nr:acetoacetate--CoA ligase [Balneolia bacterium]